MWSPSWQDSDNTICLRQISQEDIPQELPAFLGTNLMGDHIASPPLSFDRASDCFHPHPLSNDGPVLASSLVFPVLPCLYFHLDPVLISSNGLALFLLVCIFKRGWINVFLTFVVRKTTISLPASCILFISVSGLFSRFHLQWSIW